MVALDVDGTLYDGRGVELAAVHAVRLAVSAGHVVLIVTGRPYEDLQQIIPDVLEHCAAAVCEHGTLLVDLARRETYRLAPPITDVVGERIRDLPQGAAVVGLCTIGLPIRYRAHADAICASLEGRVHVVLNKQSLAFVPTGSDKGTGIEHAVGHLGLGDWGIVAVGDASNDIPMFARADVGVAVANAEPGLTALGVHQTRSPFGLGVAEAIHEFVLHDQPQRAKRNGRNTTIDATNSRAG